MVARARVWIYESHVLDVLRDWPFSGRSATADPQHEAIPSSSWLVHSVAQRTKSAAAMVLICGPVSTRGTAYLMAGYMQLNVLAGGPARQPNEMQQRRLKWTGLSIGPKVVVSSRHGAGRVMSGRKGRRCSEPSKFDESV